MGSRSAEPRSFYLLVLSILVIVSFTIWYEPSRSYSIILVKTIASKLALRQDDYSRLVNLTGFEFLIFENVCRSSSPFLLILVPSAPDHFDRRKTVRETWGRSTGHVRTVFLLGAVRSDDEIADSVQERRLVLENAEHRDLVQGNFVDSYKNLTYKHVMALKYVTYHCPSANYVLKADDDVFVNIYGLLKFFNETFTAEDEVIFCKTKNTSAVSRRKSFKWAVTVEEYPGTTYPPYCWGFAVVYSPGVIAKLYKSAQRTKYFWIDDIHVTGTLAGIHNLSLTDASEHTFSSSKAKDIMRGSMMNESLLFGYNLSNKMIQNLRKHLWKQ